MTYEATGMEKSAGISEHLEYLNLNKTYLQD